MNLLKLALAVEQWSAGHAPVSVAPEQCLNTRDKRVPCDLCAQACPTDAILTEPAIQVNADACIRCGLCLHECPTGVFMGDDGAHRLLRCAAQLVDREVVEVACKHHPNPAEGESRADAVITTNGCLSMLGASAYLGLLGLKVDRLVVRLDACAECPLGGLRPHVEAAIEMAQTLAGRENAISVQTQPPGRPAKKRPVYSVNNPPVSRRGLLRIMALQGASAADDLVAQYNEPADPESGIPQERQRRLAALAALRPVTSAAPIEDPTFTRIAATNAACTACGLCARVCPTHTLTFYENESAFALTFSAAACVNCGLCLNMCDAQALERGETPSVADIFASEPVVLHEGALKRCKKCHVVFRGEGEYCPTCAFRRQNPFGRAAVPRPPQQV